MIRQLAIFEQGCCQCDSCRATCQNGRPGALAPSDIDHIAEYLGMEEPSDEFVLSMFSASPDGPKTATKEFPDGSTPAIRPAVNEKGHCRFYDPDKGECRIYPVRPFECGRVNQCDPASGAAAMKALGNAISKSVDYMQLWYWMLREQANRANSDEIE